MDITTIVALEIGSSKICGAVGTVDAEGTLTVKIVEEEPLIDSVRYGQPRNIKVATASIQRILRKIQNRLEGRKILSAYVGIGGRSLSSIPTEVERNMPPETEITPELLNRLYLEAKTSANTDKDILAVEPRAFYIDHTRIEKDPEGMVCSDIRMTANLIVCRKQLKRNIDLLVKENVGLGVAGYVIRPIAEAELVLTPDEKRLGCMLVDFGAETTTVAIYRQGRLQYLATIPIGSRNITRDITTQNYVEEEAENIKITRGNASYSGEASDSATLPEVTHLVVHRTSEIIANVKAQIKYASLSAQELPGGIVIVGRGAKLPGFSEKVAKETSLKVRIGTATSSAVRIGDSRIPSDAVDIISILLAGSADPVECLEPKPEPEPAFVEPTPVPETDEPAGKSGNGFGKTIGRWWEKLKTAVDTDEEGADFSDDDE
ncbi:MAG: cell division protein FtsA [Paramuribaculum sp.]|nr:cell division protein FtsA [Paramuribaculum sp.]